MNYDAWFDYLRLLENDGEPDQVRETYERAISNVPPIQVSYHSYQLIMCRLEKQKHSITNSVDLLTSHDSTSNEFHFLLVFRKSVIGVAISTCGSTMPSTRSWSCMSPTGHAWSTKQHSNYCQAKNSPSQKYGSSSHSLKSDRETSRAQEKYW